MRSVRVCNCCVQMAVQPRTVVVLMNGGAVAMPENLKVPALVEAFCECSAGSYMRLVQLKTSVLF